MTGDRRAEPRDLVVVSLEAWDDVWRRNQHLVAGLLRAGAVDRVLFVEPPADPTHALSRRHRPRWGRGLRPGPVVDGVPAGRVRLHQPTKVLPRRLDPAADRRLARSVLRAARRSGMRRPVLWVNDPSAATLARTAGWPSLYDVTDDWLAADRPTAERARVARDEADLLAGCDEVTVCSPGLVRSKGTTRDVTLLTNGVDLDRYRTPAPRPGDLPPGDVALYVGTTHPDRVDVPLLVATAHALRGRAVVVLVGPVVDLAPAEHGALDRAGVVALGPRPWTAVPAYLQHAAVLLVPHVVTPFTESLDPIKLYEYRAVGRPVVATPVAGFRDAGGAVVVAPAPGFPQAVRDLLDRHDEHDEHDEQGRDRPERDPGPPDVPTWTGQAALLATVIERARRRPATPR